MSAQPYEEYVPRRESGIDIAGLIRRRKTVLASVLASSLVLTAVAVLTLEPKYEAELKLMVSRSRVNTPLNVERAGAATPQDVTEAEITSEIELLQSRDLLEKAVEECRLAPGSDRVEAGKAVARLRKDLEVTTIKKTNLISVKYATGDPDLTARVLNTVGGLYLEKHAAVHRNKQTSEFFSQQADLYGRQLAESQAALAEFERKHQASLLSEQKQTNLRRITELDSALQETRAQRHDAQDRTRSLERQIAALPATVSAQQRIARNETLIQDWKNLLLQLRLKRTELLTKYEPGYRLVQEVDQQIRETETSLAREMGPSVVDKTDAINPVRQQMEAELLRTQTLVAGLGAREEGLRGALEAHQARQQELSRMTSEHDDAVRKVKLAEDNYLLYQKKQEESRIAEALDRERILNVSIIEPAVPPVAPVERHRGFVLLLGGILGVFLAAGAAVLAEQFDRPVASADDLEDLTGMPVVVNLSKDGVSWS